MTNNPASVIDAETFTVRRSIRIDAPVERVWSAVTDPAHISQWFGHVELDGAEGTISWPDRDPIPLRVEAIDELRSVTYRWNNDDASGVVPRTLTPESTTVFTFTLEPAGDGTELTVVETLFDQTSDPVDNMRSHALGWVSELDKLVALLESAS